MRSSVQKYISTLNSRTFTNNVQRVLFSLLRSAPRTADGWVSARSIRVPSAGSRVRDLRLERFGSFEIECATATQLGRASKGRQYLYRVDTSDMTVTQLRKVFG